MVARRGDEARSPAGERGADPESIKIAVLSDLHAFMPSGGGSDSAAYGHLSIGRPQSDPYRQPFAGLRKLIEEEKLSADIVLCGGDMTDRAAPAPAAEAWRLIHEVKNQLGADVVVGAVGNHDWDSRHTHSGDPKDIVKTLSPPFPTPDLNANQHFWSEYWTKLDLPAIRIFVVNSCAYHGYEEEYRHGRVTKDTVDAIRTALGKIDDKKTNILLTHHHPQRIGSIDLEDYSEMICGHLLLDAVAGADVGPWIVVHGHKHMPNLAYASGSSTSPMVFSAGSFSAQLYSELATRARNQFYIIEIHPAAAASLSLHLAGTFRAFDWHAATGWEPAASESVLPPRGGFGCRTDPRQLAVRLVKTIRETDVPWIDRSEMVGAVPELDYLLPDDEVAVARHVREFGLVANSQEHYALGHITLPRDQLRDRLTGRSSAVPAPRDPSPASSSFGTGGVGREDEEGAP